jgi:hypothetical protein
MGPTRGLVAARRRHVSRKLPRLFDPRLRTITCGDTSPASRDDFLDRGSRQLVDGVDAGVP